MGLGRRFVLVVLTMCVCIALMACKAAGVSSVLLVWRLGMHGLASAVCLVSTLCRMWRFGWVSSLSEIW